MTYNDTIRASSSSHSYSPLDEDSFAAHLRAECAESHEILPSHTVLRRGDAPRHFRTPSYEAQSFEQVLGGFASLGVSPSDPPRSRTTSSRFPASTPTSPRLSQGSYPGADELASIPTESDFDRWSYFSASGTTDPLATLDIMSIDEMGLHSVDVGSVNDWEGCSLQANVLCSSTTPPTRISLGWSIAKSKKRQRKWVVVPDAQNIAMHHGQVTTDHDRGLRTVVVSSKPVWVSEQQPEVDQTSTGPFSGWAGYELKFLRAEANTCNTTIFLANPETHRIAHGLGTASPISITPDVHSTRGSIAETAGRTHYPIYPVLRRSRSRPYMRPEHQTLRRSRSKPYLRASAQQQNQVVDAADLFAPSLPGAPGAQYQPEESWPSARRAVSPSSGGSTRTSSGTNSSHSSLGAGATTYSQASTCGTSEAVLQAAMGSPDSESHFPGQMSSMFDTPSVVFTAAPVASPRESPVQEGRVRRLMQSAQEEWYQRLPPGAELSRVQSSESKPSTSDRSGKKHRSRKDRRLSGWFKKKVGMPAESETRPGLTRRALEQIEALVDRAESPESTVMGSRRGSEVVTGTADKLPKSQMLSPQEEEPRMSMEESRRAVAASLAKLYGWNESMLPTSLAPPETQCLRNKDETALMGLDNVPAEALTMLLPLPLLGRASMTKPTRWMRVIFVPFLSAPAEPETWFRKLAKRTRAKSEGAGGIEPFRISAVVLGDKRTFPVVLGFCDGRRGIEMVPEGWSALGMSPPESGLTDVILAAAAAVMDL